MRCTQIIGLKKEALDWLDQNNAIETSRCGCPDCKTAHISRSVSEVYDDKTGVDAGMFEDGPMLYKHKLKDGSWVYEFVQSVPWASGPCIFLALRREDKQPIQETLWTEKEIQDNM